MAIISTNKTYTFNVTGDRSLTAVFEAIIPTYYAITAAIDPPEAGTVTGTGQYQEGDTVTLTATINDGYSFTGWQENGQTVSTDNPYTFTATGNKEFIAAFEKVSTSRLPDGYQELEYITTDNSANIPVGVQARTNGTRIVMDIMPKEKVAYYRYMFIAFLLSGNSLYAYGLRQNKVANQLYYLSGVTDVSSTAATGFGTISYNLVKDNRIVIDMDSGTKKLKIGSSTFNFTTSVVSNVSRCGQISLGGQANLQSSMPALAMNIYSAQIYDAGIMYADLVPCRNSSGTLGLFNLADNTFHPAVYGNLTAGPEIT